MEIILKFLVDNYLWFLIISLILIFGLIGYIVDTHEKKAPKLHFGDSEELNNDEKPNEEKSVQELLEQNQLESSDNETIESLSEQTNNINELKNNNEENIQDELPLE